MPSSSTPALALISYTVFPAKMTLLGWMHRKLRSNHDVFKDFNTGGGGSCNCITGLASPDPEYFGDAAFATDHPTPPVNADDLFTFGGSGLLTIGTLGFSAVTIPGDDDEDHEVDVESNDGTVDEADDGAVTPTFATPAPELAAVEKVVGTVEAIAEKDDGTTTEDDLMLVSAELEKVLGGNGGGDVPSARVSFAMGVDCPLQGFLFGSPVNSDAESRPDQRDGGGRRTSLGELFMRTRFAEEKVALVAVAESKDGGDGAAGGEKEERKARKGGYGHKTMRKRRAKDEKGGGGDDDGVPGGPTTKSKFQKILQIFHRKVYPESTILTRNLAKNRKRGSPDNAGGAAAADEPVASPKIRYRKDQQRMPSLGCCTYCAFSASPDSGELNGNKSGHWIKTDADYLVLEL